MTWRPLFWFTVSFMIGLALEGLFRLPPGWAVGSLLAGLCGLVVRRPTWSIVCILLLGLGLGLLVQLNAQTLPRNHITKVRWWVAPDGEAAVKGVVVSEPVTKRANRGLSTSFVLDSREICHKGFCRPTVGRVSVRMFGASPLSYGDEVVLNGRLHRPFEYSSRGHLSYRDYLARRGMQLQLTVKKANTPVVTARNKAGKTGAMLVAMRSRLSAVFERYLPRSESGLMIAFMLGERGGIPPHVRELFSRTGTAHIIAISGLNIAMLAFMIFFALSIFRLSRRVRTFLTVGLICGYSLLVGGGAPVVRAAVMSSVFLLSFILEREQDSFNTLAAAALLILLFDPFQLQDVGFQLSFVCVLSLLVVTPVAMRLCGGQGLMRTSFARFVAESFLVSAAAWSGSLGLTAYYFGQITPVGLLANLLIVPLSALVTALGALLLVLGFVCPPVAVLVASCLSVSLNLMVFFAWLCSLIPCGAVTVQWVTWPHVAAYYGVVVLIVLILRRVLRTRDALRFEWTGTV